MYAAPSALISAVTCLLVVATIGENDGYTMKTVLILLIILESLAGAGIGRKIDIIFQDGTKKQYT